MTDFKFLVNYPATLLIPESLTLISPPKFKMNAAFQTLIAAAISFLLITAIFLFFTLLCRRRQRPKSQSQTLTLLNLPRVPSTFSSFSPSLPRISLSSISAATSNFSPSLIVGDGAFGYVYKATLPSNLTVAVKRLELDPAFNHDGLREFRAELETLAKVRHPNLIKILGFCSSGPDRVIIYEFIQNGSLDSWIHESGLDPKPNPNQLSWETRFQIILGVAKGLSFLHNECTPCIIHRDIKSSNILLDADFRARIADFGLARMKGPDKSYVSTQVAGTVGYLPPEYREGFRASVKGDVYSFGVLMFEVVSGRRPNWPVKGEDGKEVSMVGWARGLVDAGRGSEVLDPVFGDVEFGVFFDVACRCTDDDGRKRPGMREVVSMLEAEVSVG